MNEKFKGKSVDEIKAECTIKQAALAKIFADVGDNIPTPEHLSEAQALEADLVEIDTELSERREALAAFDALKTKKFGQEPVEAAEGEGVEGEGTEPVKTEAEIEAEAQAAAEAEAEATAAAEAAAVEAAAAEGEEGKKAEAAAAPKKVAQFAKQVKRPEVEESEPVVSIVAASNVPGFSAGQTLDGIADISKAAIERMRGFTPPTGDGKTTDLQKFGVATMRLPFDEDLQINRGTDEMEVLYRASNEKRLEGESLTAAGGWCSPSETLYDLQSDESLEGILSLPEVQINRGGIRYTVGPQFADFYAEAGFIQTEAQAIAGTTKPCYEVDCPSFTEVRLDAVGVCIKVPILTNAAYPELVNRFTSGTLVAHAHMVNLNVITRMVALSSAARVFANKGSAVSDAMEALELVADQRRQTYRLPLDRTMEAVVPFWVRGIYRNDLSRRNGVAAEAVSDEQIAAHFAARKINVQYVYDWQPISLTDEVYPATYQALVYPAGTFIKGVSDVINLSAVYDAASLAVNTYTGLFMEQGLLVAKMQYDSDLLTLPVCAMGRVGAHDLTCA